MKKILTIVAVALMAASAQSAQIAWSITSIAFDGATLKNASATEFTASLFFLGNKGSLATSYSEDDIQNLNVVASATTTTGKGANAGSYTLNESVNKNDDVFGMLLSYTKEGKTYYNISSTTYTLSGYTDATSTPDPYNLTPSNQTYTMADASTTKVSPGGG